MDELKTLIEVVAGLPTLTLWVLVGYLVYKLAIVGSWFAIARFCVDKLHNWLITPKTELVQRSDGGLGVDLGSGSSYTSWNFISATLSSLLM